MNEERIFLSDYIEKMRTAYHQARATFEIYSNALEKEKANWNEEQRRGWSGTKDRQEATEKHQQTQKDLKNRLEAAVKEAKAEFAEILNEAESVFGRHYRATPSQVDERGLALINSGILSKKELIALADEYAENYTMRKLIGAEMEKQGEKTRDQELGQKGRALKATPTIHADTLGAVQTWAEYALRPNAIERTAVFNRQFDQRIDEIRAKVEGYSIPKAAPAQDTGAANE